MNFLNSFVEDSGFNYNFIFESVRKALEFEWTPLVPILLQTIGFILKLSIFAQTLKKHEKSLSYWTHLVQFGIITYLPTQFLGKIILLLFQI